MYLESSEDGRIPCAVTDDIVPDGEGHRGEDADPATEGQQPDHLVEGIRLEIPIVKHFKRSPAT